MKYKHLFGPVPSRRLGVSLGVDLIPFKTCTFDCVYCECGRTTALTVGRRAFVPAGEVIKELEDFLSKKPELDYVTFSGSGEPTLHPGIGKIISFLKKKHGEYPIAVITNGSLLFRKPVRKALSAADIVIPSLDAVSENVFGKINRPAPSLKIAKIIGGIADFRAGYNGKIWLEIFIVPGLNDTPGELKKMKRILKDINPDKIQLNSLARPGTEPWVASATVMTLVNIAKFFKPLKAEIITEFSRKRREKIAPGNISEKILNTVRRRPVTAEDISVILGLRAGEVNKCIGLLLERRKIRSLHHLGKVFFKTEGEDV